MTGLVLTDDVVRPELNVVLEEQNMRVANNPGARLGEQMEAALYLNHPYRPADHRLAARDREARPRRRARVLPALLHAQQRHPGRRRRRHRRGGQDARRGDLRQGPARRRDRAARCARRSRRKSAAHRDARRPARRPSRACSAITWCRRHHRASPARARRSRCSRISSAAARTAASIDALVVDKGIAVNAGAGYHGTRARRHALQRLRHAEAGHDAARSSKRRIDAVIAEVIDKGVTADELERAKSRMIADAIYAKDNQRTLARWYGAALTTGATVEQVQQLARPHPRGDGRRRCARRRGAGSTSAARSPAIWSRTLGPRRNAREPCACAFCRAHRSRGAARRRSCCVAAPAAQRDRRSSGSSAPAASRPGWCATPRFR